MKVFVYGTLKKGYRNHYLLKNSQFIGDSKVDNFTLHSFGGFPVAVPASEQYITGEVYEVDDDTMTNLDWLEGYPSFYDRQIVETEHGNAWMYFQETVDLPHHGETW